MKNFIAKMGTVLLVSLTALTTVACEPSGLKDGRDDKSYKTVKIGDKIWMAENLNYPTVESKCYEDKPENCEKYGRLYHWDDAMKACPDGWRLPSKVDFDELRKIAGREVGDLEKAGIVLKSKIGWSEFLGKDGNGSDVLGFAALPAGLYAISEEHRHTGFFMRDTTAYFWSSTGDSKDFYAESLILDNFDGKARDKSISKEDGLVFMSVRCIKNPDEEDDAGMVSSEKSDPLTDSRNGETYKTVKIGNKVWMAENLNFDYNHGSAKSWCYDNKPENCKKYGRLYTWSAAMDSAAIYSKDGARCGDGEECLAVGDVRGVCPDGWHLPSLDDFGWLRKIAGLNAGDKDKSGTVLKSKTGWIGRNGESGNGSDALGFAVLPAGEYLDGGFRGSGFFDKGEGANFWSSTEDGEYCAYQLRFGDGYSSYHYGEEQKLFTDKGNGLSIRCIKD